MVEVGAYPTRSDAELARAALAAAGIRSVLAADDAGGAYPFDFTGSAYLLVDEAEAEDADVVHLARLPWGGADMTRDDLQVGRPLETTIGTADRWQKRTGNEIEPPSN